MPQYVARVIVHAEYDVTVDAKDEHAATEAAENEWRENGEQLIEDVTVDSIDLDEE